MLLEEMNWLQVEEYLKTKDTVLIPVGSLENHGRHMPLGTDFLIPHHLSRLIRDSQWVIAPTVPYGATDDLAAFPGTVSLGVQGLTDLLDKICSELYRHGFRRFVILNGHGGNNKSIETVGHRLYKKGALLACVNWWLIAGELNPLWKGGHGGGEETAAIMAVDPGLIKTEYLNDGEEMRNDLSDELPSFSWMSVRFQGATVTVPRPIKSITENGWLAHGMGSDAPSRADREWGTEMLNTVADYIQAFTAAFERAKLPKEGEA